MSLNGDEHPGVDQQTRARPAVTKVPDDLRLGLRGYWYPVALSTDVPADKPVAIKRLGEELVAWRDGDGQVSVLADRCPHRGARLSIGDVVDGHLQCRYHGLQYEASGQCRLVPAEERPDGPQAQRVCAWTRHAQEHAGLVWAYFATADGEDPPPLVLEHELTDPGYAWTTWMTVWNANWLLVHDNTCDPAHVPFLHGHFIAHPGTDDCNLERLEDGNPIVTEEGFAHLVSGVLTAEVSDTQVLVHLKDRPDERGDKFDEVCFTLPCLASVYVPLPDGGPPVRLHQYELPIDADTTVVLAWAGRPAPAEDQAMAADFLAQMFVPITSMIFDDDSWITENQPDVADAWSGETLLPFDIGPPRVRKLMRKAYDETETRGRARQPAD